MNEDNRIWFRRKWFGWGWMPITWQGWLATLAYVLTIVPIFQLADKYSHSNSDSLIAFAVPFIGASILFSLLIRATGQWPPRWHWGIPKDGEDVEK